MSMNASTGTRGADTATAPEAGSPPRRILVVDDQADNRIILEMALEHAGHTVLTATNGVEAVARAREHKPDIILMDLRMPEMNGWEATCLLKADPATRSIPIAALTASAVGGTGKLCDAGFCALLHKPVTLGQVRSAVEECVRGAAEGRSWTEL